MSNYDSLGVVGCAAFFGAVGGLPGGEPLAGAFAAGALAAVVIVLGHLMKVQIGDR